MEMNMLCSKCGEARPPVASGSWVVGKGARSYARQETTGATTTYTTTTAYSEIAPLETRMCQRCFDETIAEDIPQRLKYIKRAALVVCGLAVLSVLANFISPEALGCAALIFILVFLWSVAYALGTLRMRYRPAPHDVDYKLSEYARREAREQGFDTIWTPKEYERGMAGGSTQARPSS